MGGPGRGPDGPNGKGASPQQQLEPGGLVNYGPLVTVVVPGETRTPDGKLQPVVFLRAETPVGMVVLTFDPEHACRIGADLARAGREVRSGLSIVENKGIAGVNQPSPDDPA